MKEEILTFFLAMTPFGELRVSLPLALTVFHLNPFFAFLLSFFGNLVPPIFLLLFLKPLSDFLSQKSNFFQKFFSWLFERTQKKYSQKAKKYGPFLLTFFVALPLPVTGAWTGSLIAFLFGFSFKRAFLAICLGVWLAAILVTFLTLAGILIEKYFGWQVLLGFLIALLFGFLMFKLKQKKS